jgi:methionine sulfoxide reductase heme-binding subunit
MDIRNKISHHFFVALISFFLIAVLYYSGIEIGRAVAGTAFILLFLTLIIGPIIKLWHPFLEVLPWDLPWSWRGELGIWFAIVSTVHVLLVFNANQWDIVGYITGMRLSTLAGFIALFLTFILAITSFYKVIKFLGLSSWKWIQSFAYVIFYLTGLHVINHAFLRPGRPADWLHWSYLIMMIIVILLQSIAFIKTVANYRKKLEKENNIV